MKEKKSELLQGDVRLWPSYASQPLARQIRTGEGMDSEKDHRGGTKSHFPSSQGLSRLEAESGLATDDDRRHDYYLRGSCTKRDCDE